MKPKYNSSRLLNTRFGASLSTIVTVCFSSAGIALATDWVGDVSTDWNNNLNWAGDAGTPGSNAIINATTPNIATISANIVANPVDIFVGNESPNVGRLDHTAGTAQTGGGNWMFVGRRGGTGTYNLANPAGTGGTFTGMGQGSGSMTVGGRLYVGGWELTGSNGKVNVHTTGTLTMNTMLQIGTNESVGEFNLDSGTVNIGTAAQSSWFEVGNGVNCTGRFRMSGGTVTKIGDEHFSVGTNQGNGTATITGGTMSINNEIWVGQRPNSVGLMEISPGVTISNNSWVAIGREGGKGTVNMTGGTWNKTGTSNFIIGASGADGITGEGIMNLSGGSVTVAPSGDANRGITWIGEQNLSSGTLNMSGAANATTFTTARMTLGEVAGGTGTLNLNGGTLRVGQLTGGAGTANVSFNGGKIVPTSANEANFIAGLDTASVDAGLNIDTEGRNAIVPQVLSGAGTITKTGLGKLTLSGANTANGNIVVTTGSVVSTTAAAPGGTITVANSAGIGVIQTGPALTYTRSSVAMGTSAATSIDIDYGSIAGNPTVAPLTVGSINLAGTVTVNIADALPAVGASVPVISYTTKTGAGSFVLGTLPLGVVATLTDNNAGLVFLNVTSVKLPRWTGAASAVWDTATVNWFDLSNNSPTTYADPAPVLFDDNATGPTDVLLNTTVSPSKVTFANTANLTEPPPLGKNYTLTGSGKISGPGTVVKQGGGNLTIGTANDYTGSTTLGGGITSINSIANAGAASAIGAASVDPANLVLNATTLTYTGAAAGTTNRGFTIAGTNTIISSNSDLTFSGAVASTGGNLTKTGTGNLTLSSTGANVIGTVNQGLKVTGGTMTFQGSGTQTNSVAGEMWVADTPGAAASLVVNGAALNVQSWIAIGRGNGSTGNVCNMTITNSTLACNNFSTGFDNGVAGHLSTQNVTVTNSTWNNPGFTFVAESGGSTATMTLAGTTTYNCGNDFLLARNGGSTATMNINGTSSVVKTGGYSSIAQGGTATLNVNNSGSFIANGDVNVSDVGTSNGTVNMASTGTFSAGGILFVGKGPTTTGAFNQTAGTVNVGSWVSIGRAFLAEPAGKATGTVSVSGSNTTFNQTGTDQGIIVGEDGVGTLNISTGGGVNVAGNSGLLVANSASGEGTVNLNTGGTLTTKRVSSGGDGAGISKFYFNGGKLVAGAGANADFFTGMDIAEITGEVSEIDSNSNNIAINQNLTGAGGIKKSGLGTLLINGSADNEGANVVSAGTLGGTGSIVGNLTVASGASVSPGAPLGVLTALGTTTFSTGSSLTIDLDASPDMLAASNLVLNNTALVLNGTPTQPVYLLVRYASRTGTFSTPAPAGYVYDYNYIAEGFSHVALVQTGGGSPYATWINTFFPGETNQAIIGAAADPDKDGNANILEFALGGAPNSGSNNAKVYSLQADGSVDADTNKELLLTIAVRSGTPGFTPATGGSPTATHDGVVYTIQGSLNLSGFATGVTVVAPVPPAGVSLPLGYEYRTFSLDGSNNLTGKGFLRATVRPTP